MTFDALYLSYHKQMLYVANKILRNTADAEDAVQNALEKLYKQAGSLPTEPPQVLRAYVLTAAKHAALDLKDKRRETDDVDKLVLVCPDDLFDKLAASDDYGRLLAAIDTLPLHYREVLMLRYVQDCSVAQIAAALGRKQSAVRKQLTRARALLQNNYQKEEN